MTPETPAPSTTPPQALPENPDAEVTLDADSNVDTQIAAEVLPSLEDLLKAAELKAAEHHDAWLRAKAETENLRRRAQEDIARAHKFASEKFASELLAVKDSLEAALSNEKQDFDTLKAGVELTLKQLVAAFEKSGVVEIHPLNEKFDPHKHQAISQLAAEGEPNRVLQVLQKGYSLHERILRPAMVIVAKCKEATTEN